ncbi:MAG: flagellar basal body-associated protein FliL [Actinomycetes bacterium]|jgi:flagellar basal body-associated protein FliL
MGKKKDANAEEGGKKKNPLVIVGLCVALAGVGYMLGGRKAAAVPGAVTTTTIVQLEGCAPGTDAATAEHNTHDLESMSINLTDGHYLRVTVSLGLCPGVVGPTADAVVPGAINTAPAKDIIVSTLSGNSMATLQEPEGRENIKKLLTQRLAAAYPEEVHEIFFLEFVMQ